MLESEAKRKWCPMFQSDNRGDNRWHPDEIFDRNSSCLGPVCACWVDIGYDDEEKERTGRCGLARWRRKACS